VEKILHYAWKLSVTDKVYKGKRSPFAPLPPLAIDAAAGLVAEAIVALAVLPITLPTLSVGNKPI
jgi:hypothetical protein